MWIVWTALTGALLLLSCGSDSSLRSEEAAATPEGDEAAPGPGPGATGGEDATGAGEEDAARGDEAAGDPGSAPFGGDGSAGGPVLLAAGQLRLPAASAFGQPGFHEVLTASHTVPTALGSTAGRTLVVALRDVDRPGVSCGSEHPLSGCATVDWSDAESRPKVPATGVFDNRISLQLSSGTREFFLSESLALGDRPDRYNPG